MVTTLFLKVLCPYKDSLFSNETEHFILWRPVTNLMCITSILIVTLANIIYLTYYIKKKNTLLCLNFHPLEPSQMGTTTFLHR